MKIINYFKKNISDKNNRVLLADQYNFFKNNEKIFFILGIVIYILTFFVNAWVCDDAFISFRSIEQVFAGNGPRWNPHERVQAFTHPLWFGIQLVFRLFSSDVYLNVIIVSFLFGLFTIIILRKMFSTNLQWFICVIIISISNGFFDFMTSGLENVLSFFLLTLFIYQFFNLKNIKDISRLFWIFGFILLNRLDLILITFPLIILVFYQFKSLYRKRIILKEFFIGISLFIGWEIFSLIYYGFPFPNTAYAKLNTGIPTLKIWSQGLKYLIVSFRHDLIFAIIIAYTLPVLLFVKEIKYKVIAVGLVFYLLYIIKIGGDFMMFRMFTPIFIVSLIMFVIKVFENRTIKGLVILLIFFIIAFVNPKLPIKRSFIGVEGLKVFLSKNEQLIDDWKNKKKESYKVSFYGIIDEKDFYYYKLSLFTYLKCKIFFTEFFPPSEMALKGLNNNLSSRDLFVEYCIGMAGYFSGIDKIIIDQNALSDPLLARLPCKRMWRIGHFERELPTGYFESVKTGENLILDEKLNDFYDKLKIITQDKVFSFKRLKTIVLLNMGFYKKPKKCPKGTTQL